MHTITSGYFKATFPTRKNRQQRPLFRFLLVFVSMSLFCGSIILIKSNRSVSIHPDVFKSIANEQHPFSGRKIKAFNRQHMNITKDNGQQIEMRQFLTRISPHFNNISTCRSHWIVVVDISENIIEMIKRLSKWCIVVVVEDEQKIDQVGTNVFYLTAKIQTEVAKISAFFAATRQLSGDHYAARKNAGYLWAILHNATLIWDFHSDNKLIVEESTLLSFSKTMNALTVPNHHSTLFNPYPFYDATMRQIWPRGFPDQFINVSCYLNISLFFSILLNHLVRFARNFRH